MDAFFFEEATDGETRCGRIRGNRLYARTRLVAVRRDFGQGIRFVCGWDPEGCLTRTFPYYLGQPRLRGRTWRTNFDLLDAAIPGWEETIRFGASCRRAFPPAAVTMEYRLVHAGSLTFLSGVADLLPMTNDQVTAVEVGGPDWVLSEDWLRRSPTEPTPSLLSRLLLDEGVPLTDAATIYVLYLTLLKLIGTSVPDDDVAEHARAISLYRTTLLEEGLSDCDALMLTKRYLRVLLEGKPFLGPDNLGLRIATAMEENL